MGAIEPSDTESVESGRSSPSGSPLVGGVGSGSQLDPIGGSGNSGGKADHHPVIYFDSDTTDRDLSRPPNSGQNKLAKVCAYTYSYYFCKFFVKSPNNFLVHAISRESLIFNSIG